MNILHDILEAKKNEVKDLRRRFTKESFTSTELFSKKKLNMGEALSKRKKINLIAEIKKASPLKGVIRQDFDHVKIALDYMRCGVDAISVLTDRQFFKGSLSHLKDVAELKRVPILRKDFILDEFQIYESKSYGADAVLLIADILTREQIKDLSLAAFNCGLDVVLEIHSAAHLDKIDFGTNKIIGINNRDLETFKVDISTTKDLAKLIPESLLIISESGISSKSDLDYLKNTNARAVLVGEYFMKNHDISKSLTQFLSWCDYAG